MAFVQTEITAECVIDAMLEDEHFMMEMWREIAAALHKGMLLDNTCDMLRQMPLHECAYIAEHLKLISEFTDDYISHESGKE